MSFSVDKSSENPATEIENSVLKSCQTCGRTFNPKSLERHEKICEKSKKSNHRTVFNSFLQRAKEIGGVPVKAETKDKESTKNKRKLREEHENLMRVVRLGKNFPGDLLNNGLSPQKSIPPVGYQQCPSCDRYFSEKAADRHISWCQEQRTRLPKTPTNTEALERLKARVKYQAPLPKRRNLSNLNQRLVKSAESIRESSSFRTHSSPPVASRDTRPSKRTTPKLSGLNHCNGFEKNANYCASNNTSQSGSSKENNRVSKTKKAVKFKEMFPVYDRERNKNLDMLAALRIRLSELSASDDLIEDYILRSESSSASLKNHSKVHGFSSEASKESWTSDGEVHRSNSSSSNGSLPSLNRLGSSMEHSLPRFCYNCGTKYPIVSAKYCCECGAQRFIFGLNDTRLSVP